MIYPLLEDMILFEKCVLKAFFHRAGAAGAFHSGGVADGWFAEQLLLRGGRLAHQIWLGISLLLISIENLSVSKGCTSERLWQ